MATTGRAAGNDAVGLDETTQFGVIIAAAVVIETGIVIENLAGKAVGHRKGIFGVILPTLMAKRMVTVGLSGSILGTYLGKPTPKDVLNRFYRETRPFGFWRPLHKSLSIHERLAMVREHRYDIAALPFALGWQITLFLLPMQLMVRNYYAFWITLAPFTICLISLYFLWYRNLPKKNEEQITSLRKTTMK